MIGYLPTLALLFFFIFFVSVLIYIFRPEQKQYYQAQSYIPLNDSEDGK